MRWQVERVDCLVYATPPRVTSGDDDENEATAPLLGLGGVAPARPKRGRLALLSASLLLASALCFEGKSGSSGTGLSLWDAARRHGAADEVADDATEASSSTGLWSWGGAWSTLHWAADKAANGTSSAVKSALNSSAAHGVEHGIEQGAESAEHEAERALNSSAAHGAERVIGQGARTAESAAQQALNSSAAHGAERVIVQGAQTAKSAAQQALNSSAAHGAEREIVQGAQTAKSAAQQALNSSAAHGAERVIVQGAQTAESAAQQALNSSAARQVTNWTESAAWAAKSKLDHLGGSVANYTVDLSPQCVRALELGAVVATGTLAAPVLVEAVGFTAEGVAAESFASLWQSTIGDVEEGSVFALLQSLGATGVVAQTSLRAAGIEGVLAVAYCDAASAMCSSCNISVIEKQG